MRFKENSRLGSVLITQIIGEYFMKLMILIMVVTMLIGGEETCIGEYSGVTR